MILTFQYPISKGCYDASVDDLSTEEGRRKFYDKLWRNGELDTDSLTHLTPIKIEIEKDV